jgi:hypothetical protein
MTMRMIALSLMMLPVPALAQNATVTPGNTLAAPPAEWLGDVPHFVMMGTLAGRAVDIQYLDLAVAEGIDGFEGKREYLPGDGGSWRYGDFEVALRAMIDGVEKSFELEFENHDFAQHGLPATFALGDANFPEGLAAFVEVQAEWETDAGSVNDEIGGWTGTLTVMMDAGTPDGEGLVPDGMIGGFMVAENGGDRLVASFTVPVVEYEKDE